MKNNKSFVRWIVVYAVLAIIVSVSADHAFAQEQEEKTAKLSARPNPTGDGAALGSGLISLLPGQSVRVSAVNIGGKDVPLEFLFVQINDQGKIAGLVIRPDVVASGDAAFEKFTHPGGANRMMMYVQIRVRQDEQDIGLLVPSAEIFDEQLGGGPHFLLSGDDFVSFRPIFNPPLTAPLK